jgi:hypothetical protein
MTAAMGLRMIELGVIAALRLPAGKIIICAASCVRRRAVWLGAGRADQCLLMSRAITCNG